MLVARCIQVKSPQLIAHEYAGRCAFLNALIPSINNTPGRKNVNISLCYVCFDFYGFVGHSMGIRQ
jgi:hypothetical protein